MRPLQPRARRPGEALPELARWARAGFASLVLLTLAGCSHSQPGDGSPAAAPARAARALEDLRLRRAPDAHVTLFTVGLEPRGAGYALTGEVDRAEARVEAAETVAAAGLHAANEVRLLPPASVGPRRFGVCLVSVASARERPAHAAELGTQVLMGDVVKLWDRAGSRSGAPGWFRVQSDDGYLAWLEEDAVVRCTEAEAQAWQQGPLLVVTALEDQVSDSPSASAQAVSDVVVGDRLRRTGEQGEWYQVALPDGRSGWLRRRSAEAYAAWKTTRHATAANLEETARRFLGRPYLWGGCSPKGLDCSGFTQLVFHLNGIELLRNASEQARQGIEVPLDRDLGALRPGDLLFFGSPARGNRPERIVHTGIYLGGKLFIHALGRVQIVSLDSGSPLADEYRIQTLRRARRILPEGRD